MVKLREILDYLFNKLPDWLVVVAIYLLVCVVSLSCIFSMAVVSTNISMNNFEESCLNSQSIRRFRTLDYDEAVCEELINDEWTAIDPDSKNPIIYNHYNPKLQR